MPYRACKLSILGHTWTVHFMPEGQFRKKYGTDCLGVTETGEKEIYLRIKQLKREIVIHELAHAYLEELCTTPSPLEVEQLEEIYCDMVGKYGDRLIRQAEVIILAYQILTGKILS